jgi:hypothetical protein
MKNLVILLTIASVVLRAHGQGQGIVGKVVFLNDLHTALTNSVGIPFPPAGSAEYSVGLYWGSLGTQEGSLQLLPASSNGVTRTWFRDGIFYGGIASFPALPATQIQLQVRLWAGPYGSYEEAALNDPSPLLARGIVQLIHLGNAGFQVPTPPSDMLFPPGPGDTSFQGFLVPVPEPNVSLLLLLALPFLAARRIKSRRVRK